MEETLITGPQGHLLESPAFDLKHADQETHASSQSPASTFPSSKQQRGRVDGGLEEDEEPPSSPSDALEQVGVAAVSSGAVTQLPDARAEPHGTALAQTALKERKQSASLEQPRLTGSRSSLFSSS